MPFFALIDNGYDAAVAIVALLVLGFVMWRVS